MEPLVDGVCPGRRQLEANQVGGQEGIAASPAYSTKDFGIPSARAHVIAASPENPQWNGIKP